MDDCWNYADLKIIQVLQSEFSAALQKIIPPLRFTLHACVDASGEDPGAGGDCSFDEALAHHLLDARVKLKVLNSSMDRDEDLGKLHVPLLQH